MKNYLIISDDKVTIDNNVEKILKDINFNIDDVIKFDMEETELKNVIEELDTYGFFSENKVVILNSCYFLSTTKKRGAIAQDEELLIKYINNPNPLNTLIIVCDKLDDRKKINKLLKQKFILIEENLNIKDKIKNKIDGYLMDEGTINYLINYLNNDNTKILNELDKLKLYKIDDKTITKEDIENIVIKELSEDIFTLINLIVKKDIKNAINLYNELVSRGEDITKIVITLNDQFRLIYITKILISEGKNKDSIASMLKIHPYRIKLAIEESYNYTEKELLSYLKKLGSIDIGIKTGELTKEYAFEMFLLNMA